MPAPTETHFLQAAAEYDGGRARPGLVVQAEAEADGDPVRARAGYVRARAAEMASTSNTRGPWRVALRVAVVGLVVSVIVGGAVLLLQGRRASGQATDYVEAPIPTPARQRAVPPPAAPAMPASVEPAYVPPPPPPPNIIIAQVRCDVVQPDMDHGLIRGLTEALTENVTLSAVVTVRNNGGAGETGLVVWMEQNRDPLSASKSETLYLASGEERTLSVYFPEYVSGANATCYARSDPSLAPTM